MKIDLFDRYDIRARICALIFVVSPFPLDAYILVDAVRNISFTAIITAVLIASSGLFPAGSVTPETMQAGATTYLSFCCQNLPLSVQLPGNAIGKSSRISSLVSLACPVTTL